MKFVLNSPVISEKKMLDMYVAVQNEWPWVKGQLDLWCLNKTSVSLDLTCKYYDFQLKSIGTFQDFSNINALGIKFGLAVKKAKVNPDS